ncbi:DUF2225 domain-containing protein [Robertkochia sediminum]|uniref:DUF2225 domain-containing protein n=1 Tax=Robertkochia sediminum TaxID=2785326 RepID=UPI001933622D|nr:DUF2225 domain-containing protein [Robertkochia sediminum]MBL7471393.1 DUF2225 domain-containing protein [Robertkochia sediminum]
MNTFKHYFLVPAMLLAGALQSVFAHSCDMETYHCPLDGTEVLFCVTKSMYTEGRQKDMQLYGAIGTYYEELVNSCPTCYFSGYVEDFEKEYTETEKAALRAYLKANAGKPEDEADEYAIHAGIKEFYNDPPQEIADNWLTASYFLKGVKEQQEKRRAMQLKAACFFEQAVSENSCTEPQYCAIYKYLVAEMYRRTDFFEDALVWYEKAKKDSELPEWVRKMNTEQQQLAQNNDDSNDV